MPTNTALTIQASFQQGPGAQVIFGSNNISAPNTTACYLLLVVDRTDLNVVQNLWFWDNSDLQAALTPYINNAQYMMILTTWGATTDNLPVGDFYNFLVSVGSGQQLQNLEQVYAALNCGYWSQFCYILVATMDTGTPGFEYSAYQNTSNGLLACLTLMPIEVGGNLLWTPVANS